MRFANYWEKLRGMKVAIIAGVLTGGEALVAMGIPLPGAQYIPQWARAALIVLLSTLAFVMRIKAQRESHGE